MAAQVSLTGTAENLRPAGEQAAPKWLTGEGIYIFVLLKTPLGGGIEPIIRTRRESWCLLYAGFFCNFFERGTKYC